MHGFVCACAHTHTDKPVIIFISQKNSTFERKPIHSCIFKDILKKEGYQNRICNTIFKTFLKTWSKWAIKQQQCSKGQVLNGHLYCFASGICNAYGFPLLIQYSISMMNFLRAVLYLNYLFQCYKIISAVCISTTIFFLKVLCIFTVTNQCIMFP